MTDRKRKSVRRPAQRVVLTARKVTIPIQAEIVSTRPEKADSFLRRCYNKISGWIVALKNRVLNACKSALDAILSAATEVVAWVRFVAAALGKFAMTVVLALKDALLDLAHVALRREKELENQNAPEAVC